MTGEYCSAKPIVVGTNFLPGKTNHLVTYIEELVKSKMKPRLVVSGAFSLHLLHGLLENLFVSHVSLD